MTSTPSPAPEGEMKLRGTWEVRSDETSVNLWSGNRRIVTAECSPLQRWPVTKVFGIIAEEHNAASRPTPLAEGDKELAEKLRQLAQFIGPMWPNKDEYLIKRAADRLEQLSGKY